MKFEIHHYQHLGPEVQALVAGLHLKLDTIIRNQEIIMATLDQVLADVTDESTDIDSISTLIAGLKQQLADALAGAALSPATQAKVDAIFTQAEANKGKIATALAANTPPAAPTT